MQTQNTPVDANSHTTTEAGFFTRAGEAVKATASNTRVLVVTGSLLLLGGLVYGAMKLRAMANEPETNE